MARTLNIPTDLSDSEARLIEVIEDRTTQRHLAQATGFSLGMTNLLIKRLVKKGLIKVVSMNGRTLSYILTPTGFAEKLKRSYDYVATSMRYIARVRERIRTIVSESPYAPPVVIVGTGELVQLAEETLRQISVPSIAYADFQALPEPDSTLLCLICQREMPEEAPPGYEIRTLVT